MGLERFNASCKEVRLLQGEGKKSHTPGYESSFLEDLPPSLCSVLESDVLILSGIRCVGFDMTWGLRMQIC